MNQDEKRELETQLIVMGMKSLSDPGLVEQLARLIPDGSVLAGLLNECDQDKRREAYEALRPHLRFKPLPLDKYEEFFARRASQVASHHKPVEVGVDPIIVGSERFQQVAADDATGCVITFTCSKCTFQQQFVGETPVGTAIQARDAGWVRDIIKQKEICPKCPAIREHVRINNA